MAKKINEYEQLLNYFEKQKQTESSTKKQKVESYKEKVIQDTKKLVEEIKVEDYADLKKATYSTRGPDKGFDVSYFEALMRSKLIEEYKTRQSYERPYISCTELLKCLRQVFYERKRYQIDVKKQYKFSYLFLIQKVSSTIHTIFQELYDFSEVEKTVVSEKYKVKGRLDAIKGQTLFEIKSLEVDKFTGKYIDDHYIQAVIYAYILVNEYDYNIDKISIVYVLRDLKHIKVFGLPINHDLAKEYLERAPILLSALESGSVIDPIGATSEQCKYCMYLDYCKKDKFKKIPPPFFKKSESEKEKSKQEEKEDSVFLL